MEMSLQDLANAVLLAVALLVGAVVLWPRRHRPHRPWGLRPDRRTPGHYLLGVGLAAVTVGAGGLVLAISGLSRATLGDPAAAEMVTVVVYLLVLAAVEEFVFRGLLLGGLLELTTHKVLAVLAVAVAVAVPYLFAEGVTPLSFLSAVLAGVMYGTVYLVTGSVWSAAGMRAAWNLTLGPILGYTVSGTMLVEAPLLEQQLDGPTWLTGGDYGPEAGMVVIGARILLIVTLLTWTLRRTSTQAQTTRSTSE